jgi:hypothetical protein
MTIRKVLHSMNDGRGHVYRFSIKFRS